MADRAKTVSRASGRDILAEKANVADRVRALLTESMRLHKSALPKHAGERRDWRASMPELEQAYALRKEAIALDPKQESTVWRDPAVVGPLRINLHDSFMSFYADKLGGSNGRGR